MYPLQLAPIERQSMQQRQISIQQSADKARRTIPTSCTH
jgi:hypothetical protein